MDLNIMKCDSNVKRIYFDLNHFFEDNEVLGKTIHLIID